jgi:hypothetical protein
MTKDVFQSFYNSLANHFNAFVRGIYIGLPDGVSSQELKLDLVARFKDLFREILIYDPYHGLYRVQHARKNAANRKGRQLKGESIDFLTLLDRISETIADTKERLLVLVDGVDGYLNEEIVLLKLARIVGQRNFGYSFTILGFKDFRRYNPLSQLNIHELRYPTPCRSSLKDMVNSGLEALPSAGKEWNNLDQLGDQLADSLFGCPSLSLAEDILNLGLTTNGSLNPAYTEKLKLAKAVTQVPGVSIRSPLDMPSFGDVAGFRNLKGYCEARKSIFLSTMRDNRSIRLKGICLLGPPGTGKTLFAQALSHSWQIPYSSFSLSFLDKFLGASERNLDRVLRLLSDFGKPVLFHIDELSRLFGSGNAESHEVTRRVLAMLLNFLDSPESENVYTVGTMNHLQIDPALFRRFDDVFYVSLPDGEARRQLFEHFFRKYDVDCPLDKAVIKYSQGMAGSEIERTVKDLKIDGLDREVPHSPLEVVRRLRDRKPVARIFSEIQRMEELAANAGFRLASIPTEKTLQVTPGDDR